MAATASIAKFSVGHEAVHLARIALTVDVTPFFSSRAA